MGDRPGANRWRRGSAGAGCRRSSAAARGGLRLLPAAARVPDERPEVVRVEEPLIVQRAVELLHVLLRREDRVRRATALGRGEIAASRRGDRVEVRRGILAQPVDDVHAVFRDYSAGLLVSVNAFGAGRFILNTLHVRENLGRNPVADRLLLNMLRDAARDVSKPLADLPADFDKLLETIGYQP